MQDPARDPVDSSAWRARSSDLRSGEVHPPPASRVQTPDGMVRAFTPDPDPEHIIRNFSVRSD